MAADPVIEMFDDTYVRHAGNLLDRARYGHLTARTSNSVGRHYLRITLHQPRTKTEWAWKQQEVAGLGSATETHVGIRLHARQVKRLKRFLEKWLQCHEEWKEGK